MFGIVKRPRPCVPVSPKMNTTDAGSKNKDSRPWTGPGVVIAAVLVVATVLLVALSLRGPAVQEYAPTLVEPRDVGPELVGPDTLTVDARDPDRWVFFDFSRGSVVREPGPTGWDLAFRRFHVIANGGPGFDGEGGILALGPVAFDSVATVPAVGYQATEAGSDSTNPAIARWYDYGWTSHLLTPKSGVYAVRTADGRYAKLELLGYYCVEARPGCVTFRYVYQGAPDSRQVRPSSSTPPR